MAAAICSSVKIPPHFENSRFVVRIRRKLRAILLRQWKRGKTRVRYLLRYGLDPETAKRSASNGRGPWWNAGAAHMNRAISRTRFQQWGLMSLLDIVLRKVN